MENKEQKPHLLENEITPHNYIVTDNDSNTKLEYFIENVVTKMLDNKCEQNKESILQYVGNELASIKKMILKNTVHEIKLLSQECLKQNNDNTFIFLTISGKLSPTKIRILEKLAQSTYSLVIGFDSDTVTNGLELVNDLQELINKNPEWKLFGLVELKYKHLIKKYSEKINNFNGKWENNPSKLGAYDWFDYLKTHSDDIHFYSLFYHIFDKKIDTNALKKWDYMWLIEDDVYCKNWDKFINKYENKLYDLICNYENKLPFWYFNQWRVGSMDHAIGLSHLYVHRVSKSFVKCLLTTIIDEPSTSHHELFLPYVAQKYYSAGITQSNLCPNDTKYCQLNVKHHVDLNDVGYKLITINAVDGLLFHPVKTLW
jgi:hypothetical protein